MKKSTLCLLTATLIALNASAWIIDLNLNDDNYHTVSRDFTITNAQYQSSGQKSYKYFSMYCEVYAFMHMTANRHGGNNDVLWANKMPVTSSSDTTATGIAFLYYYDSSGKSYRLGNANTFEYTGNGYNTNYCETLELTYCVLDNNNDNACSKYYLQSYDGEVTHSFLETKNGVNYYKAVIKPYFPQRKISISMGVKDSEGMQKNALASNMGWQKCGGIVITHYKMTYVESSYCLEKSARQAASYQAKTKAYETQNNNLVTRYNQTSGADVNEDGKVNATDVVAVYNTIINGSYAATHTYNGYQYVDLGLPSGTLWATCNMGAVLPEDFGDLYAWGETNDSYLQGRTSFTWNNHNPTSVAKEVTVGGSIPSHNSVVYKVWGGSWDMPTSDDFIELINTKYTTTEITELNGVKGLKVTSKSNGQSIFLPCAGGFAGTKYAGGNTLGFYWSSTIYSTFAGVLKKAATLTFTTGVTIGADYIYRGASIRPVVWKGYVK